MSTRFWRSKLASVTLGFVLLCLGGSSAQAAQCSCYFHPTGSALTTECQGPLNSGTASCDDFCRTAITNTHAGTFVEGNTSPCHDVAPATVTPPPGGVRVQCACSYTGPDGLRCDLGFKTDAAQTCDAFCKQTITTSTGADAPPNSAAANNCTSAGGTTVTPPPAAEPPREVVQPNLEIKIPGLVFTPGLQGSGKLTVSWIGEYIQGLYKYLLGISVVVAIIVVMIGGLKYVMAAGTGDTKAAKDQIKNAVVGLILLFSVYLILYSVGGNRLVTFNPLNIGIIAQKVYEEQVARNVAQCKDVKGIVKQCSAKTLVKPSGWDQTLVDAVNTAAKSYGVDPILIATHLQKETKGDVNYGGKIGPCGEIGPSQFMAVTASSITNKACCLNIANKSKKISDAEKGVCPSSTTEWPPPTSAFPHCNAAKCGTCQVASQECVDSFLTPKNLQNVINATAQLISKNLANKNVNKDLALEMCAYNGGGKDAAAYATDAATIYASFCTGSGGSQ